MFLFDMIRNYLHRLRFTGRFGTKALRHEKIRLEHLDGRLAQEIDRLRHLQRALFLRGKSETQAARFTLARKIKEFDARARAKEENRSLCRQQIQIVSNLLESAESKELHHKLRAALPPTLRVRQELAQWVGAAMAWESPDWNQEFATREPDEWALDRCGEGQPDKDLVAIVAAMEDARAAEEAGDSEAAAAALRRLETMLATAGRKAERL
jgi:hypothetical protein